MTEPTRPVLRWHGGKWILAPWIISHFPEHRIYVEPFGGAGSVLMRKPRAYAEVWNDLDGQVVNLFRVLRSDDAPKLLDAVRLTPFAREEFTFAYERADCPVERARRMLIRSFMGFGNTGALGRSTGFRADSNKSGSTPAHDWAGLPTALEAIVARLRGVVIESRDALTVMAAHDRPDALHYVDPPYMQATRGGGNPYDAKHLYNHELTEAQHRDLLSFLRGLKGKVLLSGYPHPLYDEALADWRRVERQALADGARPRTEVLWLNFRADKVAGPLFDGAAA